MRFDHFDVTQRIKRLYAQAMEPVCDSWGLTRNELDVLLFLYNNPEYDRAADIVAHRGMTKSHVSLSVSNLQNRGLLVCSPDPADRRVVHLVLSQGAIPAAEQGRVAQQQFFRKLFGGISREELDFWQGILQRISDNLSNLETE